MRRSLTFYVVSEDNDRDDPSHAGDRCIVPLSDFESS
jgi:hypothetical protein